MDHDKLMKIGPPNMTTNPSITNKDPFFISSPLVDMNQVCFKLVSEIRWYFGFFRQTHQSTTPLNFASKRRNSTYKIFAAFLEIGVLIKTCPCRGQEDRLAFFGIAPRHAYCGIHRGANGLVHF